VYSCEADQINLIRKLQVSSTSKSTNLDGMINFLSFFNSYWIEVELGQIKCGFSNSDMRSHISSDENEKEEEEDLRSHIFLKVGRFIHIYHLSSPQVGMNRPFINLTLF